MKTIRYLFYMILILSNIEVLKGDYSITTFIDYLLNFGYYEIIQTIKIFYGEDIAINVCEELTKNKDCETVVRVYMITGGSVGRRAPIFIDPEIYQPILEYFENKYNITEEIKRLIEVILNFYENLIKNMNEEEIITFIEKIIKNPDILNYLYN